jgi:hypothetical protein
MDSHSKPGNRSNMIGRKFCLLIENVGFYIFRYENTHLASNKDEPSVDNRIVDQLQNGKVLGKDCVINCTFM